MHLCLHKPAVVPRLPLLQARLASAGHFGHGGYDYMHCSSCVTIARILWQARKLPSLRSPFTQVTTGKTLPQPAGKIGVKAATKQILGLAKLIIWRSSAAGLVSFLTATRPKRLLTPINGMDKEPEHLRILCSSLADTPTATDVPIVSHRDTKILGSPFFKGKQDELDPTATDQAVSELLAPVARIMLNPMPWTC